MSAVKEAFDLVKKILLVSEQIDRLTDETKALSRATTDHEIRLVRIETTLDIARQSSKLTLPGN